MSDSISVLAVPEAAIARDVPAGEAPALLPQRVDVPTADLRQELAGFLERMDGAVRGLPDEVGGFQVTRLDLNLAVTATGKVSLLGIGGELAGTAGLSVTLERRPRAFRD
jgi:hypothetical protein